ncbi:DNAJ domain-containing protein [Plasmodium falciparum IGH-CR14]|uniref:DNAJ domain-containing protein n=1 Tax=Plasmodium falciparum IGH-CR14 TaxID=580059 RepID=A0A0L1IEE8_PLAFA|nr:DNAJ domain-containing protein [Plasmodium falciparum IGH-CR14]
MIIIVPFIFFNLIFTSDMMYEYIENTKVPIFVKLFFGKSIFIEDIFYYVGMIMKEMMEGQNIREEEVAELLKDRLDLYIDNEDEWEKLMENEISMLLKSSFSNFILESIGWTYENVSNIFLEEKANSGINKKDIYLKEANERMIRNSIVLRQSIDNLYYEHILNLLEEEKNEILEEILRNILKIILCDVETTVRRSAQKVLQNAEGDTNLMFKRAKGLQSLGKMILQKVN